jgi:hypothetical protein
MRIARAVVSGAAPVVDNLDVLLAVLDGIRSAGAGVEVRRRDPTERRMYAQIASSAVPAHAKTLLRDYVSPFTGASGAENPLVLAGARAVELRDRARLVPETVSPRTVAFNLRNCFTKTGVTSRGELAQLELG